MKTYKLYLSKCPVETGLNKLKKILDDSDELINTKETKKSKFLAGGDSKSKALFCNYVICSCTSRYFTAKSSSLSELSINDKRIKCEYTIINNIKMTNALEEYFKSEGILLDVIKK